MMKTLSPSTQQVPHLLNVIELQDEIGTGEVAVIPGGYAYFLNLSGTVAVLDGPEFVTLVDLEAEKNTVSGDMIVHPNSKIVYVADSINRTIHIIKNTENITDVTLPGMGPTKLAVNTSTDLVYVGGYVLPDATSTMSAGVSVLRDTSVVTHIPMESSPKALVMDTNNNLLYAGLSLPPNATERSLLAVIQDTEVLTKTDLGYDTSETGSIPKIAVNSSSGESYLLENAGTIVHFDNNHVERVLLSQMNYFPITFVSVDPTRNLAYVGVQNGPPSDLVILRGSEIVTTLPLEYDPQFGVYDVTHDYMYIANYRSGSISVIRGVEIIATLSTEGDGPRYIGLDEERGYIYVSNADSHSIAVFGYEETPPTFWQQYFPFLVR